MRRRIIAGLGASLALAITLTGCAMSSEAEGYATEALCASSGSAIQALHGGGAAARAAAVLIRDNVDDQQVKDTAQKIIDGDTDAALRADLTVWVEDACA